MAWTNLSWADGDILTSTDMNLLYDNFAALAAGGIGIPQFALSNVDLTKYTEGNQTMLQNIAWYPEDGWYTLYPTHLGFTFELKINGTWSPATTLADIIAPSYRTLFVKYGLVRIINTYNYDPFLQYRRY